MSSLGSAYVQIVPTAKGIGGALGKVLSSESAPAGEAAGHSIANKIKGIIAGAAIGTTVVAGIKKSIGEGAELEQSLGGIETLFKSSASKVIANASKAYKTAGTSANEYMQNVTSFSAGLIKSLDGDTAKAANVADTAMRDMSDNANKMGTDITSIQNAYQGFAKQNYTMLDNLKLGYGGTKAEMERLLEDASKISGQEYDMSNLSDVYEAIHVVQTELGITGTTAKEAASTLSGSFGSMKAAFSDFMGNLSLGRDVGPAMKNLVDSAVTFLGGNLIPAIGNIFKNLPAAVNAGIQAVSAHFNLSSFNKMFSQAVDNIANNLPKMLEGIGQKFNEIAPVIAEEGAFIILKLGEGIIKALPGIVSAAGQIVNAILKVIVGIPVLLIAKGLAIAGKFALGLLKGVNKIANAAGKWVSGIIDMVKSLPGKVVGWAIKTATGFGDKLKSGFKGAVDKIKGTFDKVKEFLTKPFDIAKDKIKGIIDGIKGFFPIKIGNIFSNLKLPKISVSGGKAPFGIGGMGSLPHFNVSWQAKGGIMNGPTLFGGGEAGPEAILPLDPFWKKLDRMQTGTTINNTFNINGASDPEKVADAISSRLSLQMRSM